MEFEIKELVQTLFVKRVLDEDDEVTSLPLVSELNEHFSIVEYCNAVTESDLPVVVPRELVTTEELFGIMPPTP